MDIEQLEKEVELIVSLAEAQRLDEAQQRHRYISYQKPV